MKDTSMESVFIAAFAAMERKIQKLQQEVDAVADLLLAPAIQPPGDAAPPPPPPPPPPLSEMPVPAPEPPAAPQEKQYFPWFFDPHGVEKPRIILIGSSKEEAKSFRRRNPKLPQDRITRFWAPEADALRGCLIVYKHKSAMTKKLDQTGNRLIHVDTPPGSLLEVYEKLKGRLQSSCAL
jgi:hypothetical protein